MLKKSYSYLGLSSVTIEQLLSANQVTVLFNRLCKAECYFFFGTFQKILLQKNIISMQ